MFEFRTTHLHRTIVSVTLLALCATVNVAYSQSLLEEVVVTAQKREESVQDVGIAITAFTGEQLDSFGFNDSTEITSMTPGVHISGNNGGNTVQFTIRGSTQSDFADLLESPNAVYVDEAYIATGQGHRFAQFDMQRVEILKGPQGTLFGRNATGGLVQYITNKPTDEFEAYGDLTYGSYNTVRFEGAVSGPISDNFKGRLSGFVNRNDSYLDNVFPNQLPAVPGFLPGRTITGSPSGSDDIGNNDEFAIRGQGLFEFSESSELLLSGQYAQQNPGSGPYQNVGSIAVRDAQGRFVNSIRADKLATNCEELGPGGACINNFLDLDGDGVRPRAGGDFFGYIDADGEDLNTSTDHTVDNFDKVEIYSFTGNFSHDINDSLSMTWLHNYSHQEKRQSLDVDSGPAPQFIVMNNSEHDWYTQELRFNGDADRLRWVAGGYYMYIDAEYNAGLADTIGGINVFGASPPPNGFGNPNIFLEGSLNSELETNSYSLFGQVDYDLTDQWTAIFGLRWIHEKKDFDFGSFFYVNVDDRTVDNNGTRLAPLLPAHSEKTSDDLWAGKVQLNFAPNDDWLFYAGVNRGVKAGSFNAPLLTFLNPSEYGYGEEKLVAYEAGFKATLWQGKARLNATVYHYDYSDYQAFQFIGTSGAVFNADARHTGLEVDLATTPFQNFDFVFGLSLIDPEVKDVNVAPGVSRDVKPTFTPTVQMSGLARYTFPAAVYGGDVSFQMDSNYASSSFYNINNFDSHKMPAYVLGNARVAWYSDDGKWDAQFFVKNIADARNQTIGFELATICGCDERSFGNPRWFGFSLRYNY